MMVHQEIHSICYSVAEIFIKCQLTRDRKIYLILIYSNIHIYNINIFNINILKKQNIYHAKQLQIQCRKGHQT